MLAIRFTFGPNPFGGPAPVVIGEITPMLQPHRSDVKNFRELYQLCSSTDRGAFKQ